MNKFLQQIFFLLFVRPLVLVVLGINVRNKECLPKSGPAIIVANHNSHLDTLVLMTICSSKLLYKLRPVAAADYFLKNALLAWFSQNIMRIIPISRKVKKRDPLKGAITALKNHDILILYPEGSRGEPEEIKEFKSGIAHLAKKFPEVPITPVFMHGLGKSLPKGDPILVPFFCDVFVGKAIKYTGDKNSFMEELTTAILELSCD